MENFTVRVVEYWMEMDSQRMEQFYQREYQPEIDTYDEVINFRNKD